MDIKKGDKVVIKYAFEKMIVKVCGVCTDGSVIVRIQFFWPFWYKAHITVDRIISKII